MHHRLGIGLVTVLLTIMLMHAQEAVTTNHDPQNNVSVHSGANSSSPSFFGAGLIQLLVPAFICMTV